MSYKNEIPFFFNISMRQTLTDKFWGFHKNVNFVSFKAITRACY